MTRAAPSEPPTLDVDMFLDNQGTQIIVCCGSGGVGKTTTAAALALRAAERGRHAAVLTIDPAHRLAQSMGLRQLDNEPRAVTGVDETAGGSLAAGHPFAATGGRIVATLAKLLAEKGSGRGLISICAAGGQGVVAVMER